MPNKFPSTNCFVITYIYVDARIYRFCVDSLRVRFRHREKIFIRSIHLYFSFHSRFLRASLIQITLSPYFSSNPPLPSAISREEERKAKSVGEVQGRTLRIESNGIESCRVSWMERKKRRAYAFLSEGGKYAKEHRGRCIPCRKEGALFAKSNNRDALSNVTGTTREHFFPANERKMARLDVRI